jgi:molybdopterin molybdotransferase
MLTFEQALEITLAHVSSLDTEAIPFRHACGRILGEDLCSDIDMPPFDKSAVDGFACRTEDLPVLNQDGTSSDSTSEAPVTLTLLETIPAGSFPSKQITPGTCSRIMTGGVVPEGANCVVMVEDTAEADSGHINILPVRHAKNICRRGEDITSGQLVLSKGTLLGPAHIAVLSAIGAVNPSVVRLPVVGIIPTGDELVEPSVTPGPAQIRNSNGWQLEAQVNQVPAIPVCYPIAGDDPAILRQALETALEACDVVLLTGGVSMGDFDYVPEVMKNAGADIIYKSIAIQPGRPTVFGKRNNKTVFGLPGNPVSSFILFELLVKPFLRKMTGGDPALRFIPLPLGQDFRRKRTDRKSLVPVIIRNGEVFPVEYHGSAHINAYTTAEAAMIIEKGVTAIGKGEKVDVRLF